jgi:hypothetical protein
MLTYVKTVRLLGPRLFGLKMNHSESWVLVHVGDVHRSSNRRGSGAREAIAV